MRSVYFHIFLNRCHFVGNYWSLVHIMGLALTCKVRHMSMAVYKTWVISYLGLFMDKFCEYPKPRID